MTTDPVQNAFTLLLETLQKSQKTVKRQGKTAFEKGDFTQAEKLSERGLQLQQMTDQIMELQKQWDGVFPKQPERTETQPLEPLNLSKDKIARLYKEYSGNLEEKRDYLWRKNKYERIPAVLEQLIAAENQEIFFDLYESLVGKPGEGALWHSGMISRSKRSVANQYQLFQEMVIQIRDHPEFSASELFTLGSNYKKQIKGLGVNVMTEVMHSYYINRCPVLNKNSVTSMKFLVNLQVPSNKNSFKASDYQRFAYAYQEYCQQLKMENFGQVDHFFNYVYWKYAKKD